MNPCRKTDCSPFYDNGKAAGTLWTIAHNDSRKFNAEDLRPLQSLGRFASAGIAVTTIRHRGQFELRTRTDTHLRDGEFNKTKRWLSSKQSSRIPKNKGLH